MAIVHTGPERQAPRPEHGLEHRLTAGHLEDCLSLGLGNSDIAAHLNKKDVNIQHRHSK